MKKLTLLETYLHEKNDSDSDIKGKVNKELGNFKSLLHGEPKDNKPKNDIDKELDNAKWELTEDMGERGLYDIFENDRLIGQAESLKSAMQQVKGLPSGEFEVKKNGKLIGYIDQTGNFAHSIEEKQNPFNDSDKGFDLEPENPFDSAVAGHEAMIQNNKFNTKPEDAFGDAFNSSVKEAVIGIDGMDPMDELEHVSLVIHPNDGTESNVDPLMTPMGGCDSENASVSTFAAPGGPDFEKSGINGGAMVLADNEHINNEAHTFNPNDLGLDDALGDNEFEDDGDDEWLSYLVEPELEKHNIHSNDMKGSLGTQGTGPTAVTTSTKPTMPTKECNDGMMKMKENVSRLKSQLVNVRKSLSKTDQLKQNVNKLKKNLKDIK